LKRLQSNLVGGAWRSLQLTSLSAATLRTPSIFICGQPLILDGGWSNSGWIQHP